MNPEISSVSARLLRACCPRLAGALLVSSVAAFAQQTTTVVPLDYPAQKIFSVSNDASTFPTLTSAQITQYAKTFTLSQSPFDLTSLASFRGVSGKLSGLTFVKYMNSSYTEPNAAAVLEAEQMRDAICVTFAGNLVAFLNNTATSFNVSSTLSPIPIKASTVLESANDRDHSGPSPTTAHYVFWVQIGSERMKVLSITPNGSQYTLTVRRGLDGTAVMGHAINAIVYSPVYVGAGTVNGGGTSGNFPGGTASDLRYCLDPNNATGNANRSDLVLDRIDPSQNFDGAWLDTCNTGTFNLCDTTNRSCRPWDTVTDAQYDELRFRDGQDSKMKLMQDEGYVYQNRNRYPVLVANNLKVGDLNLSPTGPENQLMAALLKSTTIKPRPIDGFCMESFFDASRSTAKFDANLQALRQGILQNLAVMPILGNAGVGSVTQEEYDTWRAAIEPFGYAMYLLAVQPNQSSLKSMFGTYAFHNTGSARVFQVDPQYTLPIGNAMDTYSDKTAYTAYEMTGDPQTYLRDFENGISVVHKDHTGGATSTVTINLPGYYIDPATSTFVNAITMGKWTGKVLLKQRMALPPSPWTTADFGVTGSNPGNGHGYGGYDSGAHEYLIGGAGAGVDASGSVDTFRWMYQALGTSVTITAHVNSITGGTSNDSQVGLIIRGSTSNAGAKYASCTLTKGDGINAQFRLTTGGGVTATTFSPGTAFSSYWLRLVRNNDTFTAYRSTNGTSWSQVGSPTTISMGNTSYVGFIATNNAPGLLVHGIFDSVTVTTP